MGNVSDKAETFNSRLQSSKAVSIGLKRSWGSARKRARSSGAALKYGYSVEVLVRRNVILW